MTATVTALDVEVADILEGLIDARIERMDAQIERIRKAAYWMGRQVRSHDVTREDVNHRLRSLCTHSGIDADNWLPWDIAHDVAVAALAEGVR